MRVAWVVAGTGAGVWIAAKVVESKFETPTARLALLVSGRLRARRRAVRGVRRVALVATAASLAWALSE